MYEPWTLTCLGSIRWPGGFIGSNPNEMPDTWGNRPSSVGYIDTPFSRAATTWRPTSMQTSPATSHYVQITN